MRLVLDPKAGEMEEDEVVGGDPIRRPSKIALHSFTGPVRGLPSDGCIENSAIH